MAGEKNRPTLPSGTKLLSCTAFVRLTNILFLLSLTCPALSNGDSSDTGKIVDLGLQRLVVHSE